MNEQNFEEYLDLHGSELSSWPEHLRDEAYELLSQSSSAQALLDAQVAVDQVLADVMVVPKTFSLEQKIGIYLGAANQELPVDLAEDLTYVTFYDYEEWSGEMEDES